MDLIILSTARKRGYRDGGRLYMVSHAIDIYHQDDDMAMYIGPDAAGRLMEVGTITLRDGHTAITHAMRPARSKYFRR